jgi:adenylate cyclase
LIRQYEKAVRQYKEAIQLESDDMISHLNLALCYVQLGRDADAHDEAAEVLRINPQFSTKSYAKYNPLKDETARKNLVDDMQKAGLPE